MNLADQGVELYCSSLLSLTVFYTIRPAAGVALPLMPSCVCKSWERSLWVGWRRKEVGGRHIALHIGI